METKLKLFQKPKKKSKTKKSPLILYITITYYCNICMNGQGGRIKGQRGGEYAQFNVYRYGPESATQKMKCFETTENFI